MCDPKTILVIDDDQDIIDAVCARLRAAGYASIYSRNGTGAIEAAIEHQPDAILMDICMPGTDGLTLLKRLQQRADTKHIPVVMLSARITARQQALDAGARFFVPKPYESATLLDAVHHVTHST